MGFSRGGLAVVHAAMEVHGVTVGPREGQMADFMDDFSGFFQTELLCV